MTTVNRPAARRRRAGLIAGLAVVVILAATSPLLGVPVVALAALLVGVRAVRRRPRGLLVPGLLLCAGAPVGLLLWEVLGIAGAGSGPPALHALAVTAYAGGTACLVAGILVLAVAWARASRQRTGPAVVAVAAVGAVAGWNVFWWAWGRAFLLADAGRSTAAYDPVQDAAGLVTLACAGVGLLAAVATLVRRRQQRGRGDVRGPT